MVPIPILTKRIMKTNKKLLVTAKYGSLECSETARPYDENAQDEQVETCVKSIRRKIANEGRTEMMDSFQVTCEIIE